MCNEAETVSLIRLLLLQRSTHFPAASPLNTCLPPSFANGRSGFKWEARLFYIYKVTFKLMLQQNRQAQYFLILEDDTLLIDEANLILEMNEALRTSLPFYSFWLSHIVRDEPVHCIYTYGMLAFLISRCVHMWAAVPCT